MADHRSIFIKLLPRYRRDCDRIARDKLIVQMYRDGATRQEIADATGVTTQAACRILRLSGAVPARADKRGKWFLVIDDYLAGVPRLELPARHTKGESTIDCILAASVGSRDRAVDEMHADRAVELSRQGQSIDDIALTLGIKPLGVEYYISRGTDE